MTQADAYCEWVHGCYMPPSPADPFIITRYQSLLVYTFADGSRWLRRNLGYENPLDPSGLACESLGTFGAPDSLAAALTVALAVAWGTADTEWDEYTIAELLGIDTCDACRIMEVILLRYLACYALGADRLPMPTIRMHSNNHRTLGAEYRKRLAPVGRVFPTDLL